MDLLRMCFGETVATSKPARPMKTRTIDVLSYTSLSLFFSILSLHDDSVTMGMYQFYDE